MHTILQSNNPVLRQTAKEIRISDILSPKIKKIIAGMKEILATQDDGIAIAAPQIGQSLRLFIVSGFVLKQADKNYKGEDTNMVFINPEITKHSQEKKEAEEGCLSVRWKYGRIKRSVKVNIKAYDEAGKPFKRGASGVLAQVFQHEVDHLNGVLFIDKAYDIRDVPPFEKKENKITT